MRKCCLIFWCVWKKLLQKIFYPRVIQTTFSVSDIGMTVIIISKSYVTRSLPVDDNVTSACEIYDYQIILMQSISCHTHSLSFLVRNIVLHLSEFFDVPAWCKIVSIRKENWNVGWLPGIPVWFHSFNRKRDSKEIQLFGFWSFSRGMVIINEEIHLENWIS